MVQVLPKSTAVSLLASAFNGLCRAAIELGPAPSSTAGTRAGTLPQDLTVGTATVTRLKFLLPQFRQLAAALLEHWARPEQQQQDALQLAQAAAARSCAYLRCSNVGGEGGPAVGQGAGSQRCGACRAVWYCSTACSHADWRQGGHRRVCKALGAARQQQKQQAAAAQQAAS